MLQKLQLLNDIPLFNSTYTEVEEGRVYAPLEHLLHTRVDPVIRIVHKLPASRVLVGAAGEEVVAAMELGAVAQAIR